ncbi:MAG: deoxyguanosinetriphosphate triphosphohydrolase [Bacillota bacterium]|jgi:dGTPase
MGPVLGVRQRTEEIEAQVLSPFATLSSSSKGRAIREEPCPVRTAFQRDRDRIVHSKAFRRLKDKTQVFLAPEADHFRTRLTHTLEVCQIARTIARGLRLNEDLTEAIALGHDLGHTPFGHAGEEVLARVHPGGFAHEEQSLRVVDHREGGGLNLTWEVRDGIVNHRWKGSPSTLEGQCVQVSDRIAYVNHDIDDAIRGQVISAGDLPKDAIDILGKTHGQRINTLVTDVIAHSFDKPTVSLGPEALSAMDELRMFLFERVYISSIAKREEDKAKGVVEALYSYYCENPHAWLGRDDAANDDKGHSDPIHVRACDYVAGMTDRFAIAQYRMLFVPKTWSFDG